MADVFPILCAKFFLVCARGYNKREVGIIKKAFSYFEIIEISELISIKAKNLIEKYAKSHGLLIPDALIGATALEFDLPLYTTNIKDFQFIPDLVLI